MSKYCMLHTRVMYMYNYVHVYVCLRRYPDRNVCVSVCVYMYVFWQCVYK